MEKKFLSFEEARDYLGMSASWLYKLTHRNQIVFYKPNGKLLYFLPEDLDAYLSQHRVKSAMEIEREAATQVTLKKGGRN